MLEDYSPPQLIATWNSARGVWEKPIMNILCGHLAPFSEILPTSGLMLGGKLFPRVTPERHTDGNEYLLLRTPLASEAAGGTRSNHSLENGGHQLMLRDQVKLFPTPNTMDMLPVRTGDALERVRKRGDITREKLSTISNLRESVIYDLLPTPQVDDSKNTGQNKKRRPTLASAVYGEIDWGRFDSPIKKWEIITNRSAPPPTEPNGRDGQYRLSPLFIEWMMGLPAGWITDTDIPRNAKIKAAGNGVVPQQAALAIRKLLSD